MALISFKREPASERETERAKKKLEKNDDQHRQRASGQLNLPGTNLKQVYKEN